MFGTNTTIIVDNDDCCWRFEFFPPMNMHIHTAIECKFDNIAKKKNDYPLSYSCNLQHFIAFS